MSSLLSGLAELTLSPADSPGPGPGPGCAAGQQQPELTSHPVALEADQLPSHHTRDHNCNGTRPD